MSTGTGKESVMNVPGRPRQYSLLECQLIEAVKNSIQYELYSNAAFLCERLYAEIANEEVKLLLAECYLGNIACLTKRRKQTL